MRGSPGSCCLLVLERCAHESLSRPRLPMLEGCLDYPPAALRTLRRIALSTFADRAGSATRSAQDSSRLNPFHACFCEPLQCGELGAQGALSIWRNAIGLSTFFGR